VQSGRKGKLKIQTNPVLDEDFQKINIQGVKRTGPFKRPVLLARIIHELFGLIKIDNAC
jgi:hypothetical protein